MLFQLLLFKAPTLLVLSKLCVFPQITRASAALNEFVVRSNGPEEPAQTAGEKNVSAQWGLPNPTDPPDFQYKTTYSFKSDNPGKCSKEQQDAIMRSIGLVGDLATRTRDWNNDGLHDWSGEALYWFGEKANEQETYIKNNFRRIQAATKEDKNGYINTYIYMSCDYDWSGWGFGCGSNDIGMTYANNYGWFRRWDTIYWNFCSSYWNLPSYPELIESVINSTRKNPHYMENYWHTREIFHYIALSSIRSIGIKTMRSDQFSLARPSVAKEILIHTGIEGALKTATSYYYFAMGITVPESYSWRARPVYSSKYPEKWLGMIGSVENISSLDNSDGFTASSALTLKASVITESSISPTSMDVTRSIEATPTDVTGFIQATAISDATSKGLTDTVHPMTHNCFTLSSSNNPTLKCDCGSTTVPLTVQDSTTSCVGLPSEAPELAKSRSGSMATITTTSLNTPDPSALPTPYYIKDPKYKAAEIVKHPATGKEFQEGLANSVIGEICSDKPAEECNKDKDCASSKSLDGAHKFKYAKQPKCPGDCKGKTGKQQKCSDQCPGFKKGYFNAAIEAKPNCSFVVGKDYCRRMFEASLHIHSGDPLYGGVVEDNCAWFYFAAGEKMKDFPKKRNPKKPAEWF